MKQNKTKKKIVLGIILVSAIAVAGLQNAGAGQWGGGPNKWSGSQCGECDGSGYSGRQYSGRQQLDDKSIESRDAFLGETVELRKGIATKKAEKRALMLNENPDAKRVAQLTGELFDLREQLQSKAQEKGLRNAGFGRGQGRGCDGPGSRGFQGRMQNR